MKRMSNLVTLLLFIAGLMGGGAEFNSREHINLVEKSNIKLKFSLTRPDNYGMIKASKLMED